MALITKIDFSKDVFQRPGTISYLSGSTSIGEFLFIKDIKIDTIKSYTIEPINNSLIKNKPDVNDVLAYDGTIFKPISLTGGTIANEFAFFETGSTSGDLYLQRKPQGRSGYISGYSGGTCAPEINFDGYVTTITQIDFFTEKAAKNSGHPLSSTTTTFKIQQISSTSVIDLANIFFTGMTISSGTSKTVNYFKSYIPNPPITITGNTLWGVLFTSQTTSNNVTNLENFGLNIKYYKI
jgi:hypothetical protein